MIFAAGFGTRMKPLTDDRPKPLVTVGSQSLLDHALEIGTAGNADPIVVNAHYKAEMIVDHLAGSDVQVITETPQILDTGGGLKNALPHLPGDAIATLNSDAVWSDPNALEMIWNAWDPAKMDALLMVVPKTSAHGHLGAGDFDLSPENQPAFRTKDTAPYVYTGLQIIKSDTLSTMDETVFSLRILWERFAKEGGLYGTVYPGTWCDVGHPEAIPMAEALLKDRDV